MGLIDHSAAVAGARMAPLAVLPVFLALAGRRAVVAGNGEAVAWKVELLLAAGADVHAYAPQPGKQLIALSNREPRLILTRRCWQPADLLDAALAVAEAVDVDTAYAFHTAARAANIPCNVIDRPECSDFQFGTIVNRSPVVVGISTAGAVPVLGQAIRRRIEAILPAEIGRWAGAARSVRARIARAVGQPLRRRMIWSRFAEAALASPPGTNPEACLDELLSSDETSDAAGATLVGAGPGGTEFLTFAAVRALQSADVVLHDALVSPEVLELSRREAERIDVGKRAARHSCSQDAIIDLMIALVRKGKRVVRLKAGDPLIFGRAAEEIEALRGAGISVDVVPGITAGLALAARLGASLTDRRVAHSLRLVTGHGKGGSLPEDLDWRGLADPKTTLVVYMAGRTAAAFSRRLVAAGLAPDTPAVAAAGLGKPGERIMRGPLDALDRLVGELDPGEPILIGIGAVFADAVSAMTTIINAAVAAE
jgi:uroporphyrin-III C-methyltransferase/precorrin-2 dehydrogenase/sirohydrochlorin ferrochelatase